MMIYTMYGERSMDLEGYRLVVLMPVAHFITEFMESKKLPSES